MATSSRLVAAVLAAVLLCATAVAGAGPACRTTPVPAIQSITGGYNVSFGVSMCGEGEGGDLGERGFGTTRSPAAESCVPPPPAPRATMQLECHLLQTRF